MEERCQEITSFQNSHTQCRSQHLFCLHIQQQRADALYKVKINTLVSLTCVE